MLTVYHRAADIHTRGIDAADEFTIQGENLETALFTRRANKYWVIRVAVIHHHAVSTYQVMFFILIVSSAKLADKLSAAVELQDIIRSISIGYIYITIGCYSSLRRMIGFLKLIGTYSMWLGEGKNDASLDICLHHIAML